ncbi:uroporphyrinogen-III C-methyltransferase [Parasporobacterium paucivorans]|uniref:uroporphyrinogen-III C-methyltransferase n=1 Tax=Parasporobacterium paucivorans DSM 15970 TaxID=1122934 RepID=A0A1M6DSQ1_9FIRM|nr:uroporphyrinogen-III C-methyltransferase [Parasporobacterium paucivorans]SHI76203.1 uroporphyrinogen-III synthase [Parasporobacterium paucivorans DSM 15970]
MGNGKVWLVGAGPGDVGLLTIKGMKVIEEADVVVYDRLVGMGILSLIPDKARCIDVGKTSGNHMMSQEGINKLLLEEAKNGNRVVRLKGGDPFLFGRGGEEIELLVKEGIPYEIVPGITSAISVPAYNGIPVTHRDFTSSVHIITGHKKKDEEYDIDFSALVKTKGTLVFLMGLSELGSICKGLSDAGMDKNMPVAVLERGTTAKQRKVISDLSTIEETVRLNNISTPAIIVVGKVCSLSKGFSWYEKLPLAGCRIAVTRPKELISGLSEKLRIKGAEVIELPAIRIEPIKENLALKQSISNLASYQWIVFTSPSGVNIFFEEMKSMKADIRSLAGLKIAVIGEGTLKMIEGRGLYADLVPSRYDAENLGKELGAICFEGDRMLIPRADIGNILLVEEIKKRKNVVIDDIPTYRTVYEGSRIINEKEEFQNRNIDYALFTSASTVRGFVSVTEGLDYGLVNAVCIGAQTKKEADGHGMKTQMAEKATLDSLVRLVEELHEKQRQGNEK